MSLPAATDELSLLSYHSFILFSVRIHKFSLNMYLSSSHMVAVPGGATSVSCVTQSNLAQLRPRMHDCGTI